MPTKRTRTRRHRVGAEPVGVLALYWAALPPSEPCTSEADHERVVGAIYQLWDDEDAPPEDVRHLSYDHPYLAAWFGWLDEFRARTSMPRSAGGYARASGGAAEDAPNGATHT